MSRSAVVGATLSRWPSARAKVKANAVSGNWWPSFIGAEQSVGVVWFGQHHGVMWRSTSVFRVPVGPGGWLALDETGPHRKGADR